jgi:dolichol-phosphate mannosyltransferase
MAMSDEAAVVRAPTRQQPVRLRVRAAVRRPTAWLQLLRFGLVGASGYVVNLAVFTVAVHGAGLPYQIAATLAFLVAVSNNFLWNRHWTFKAGDGRAHHQAARFLAVSVAAFAVGLVILTLLVEVAGLREVPAQAIAIVAVTPLSFLANKLWSFSR